MIDTETGKKMTDKEIIGAAQDMLAEVVGILFECETYAGKQLAFMADALLKLGTVVYNGDCPLDAAADYTRYENKKYHEHLARVEALASGVKLSD
jgi:hypothetical protein